MPKAWTRERSAAVLAACTRAIGRWSRAPASARVFVIATLAVVAVGLVVSCQNSPTASPSATLDGPLGEEPAIRVRVLRAEPEALVTSPGGVLIARSAGGAAEPATSVRLRREGSAWRVDVDGSSGRTLAPGQTVTVRTADAASGLLLNGGAMPGSIELRVEAGGLDAVAEMPMERYLEGVMAGELISGWPLGAFQAQAVAARSYALHERGRARAKRRWHDVENTTLDQVFAAGARWPQAEAAVLSTRGVVLVDDAGVLRAYFSSTCGGRPASAAGIWPSTGELAFNTAAPLQARPRPCPCERSPLYRWTRERTAAEIRARLRAWGASAGHPLKAAGEIAAVLPAAINRAGRPDTFIVREAGGREHELLADDLRTALNWPAAGLAETTRDSRVASNDFEVSRAAGGVFVIEGRGFGHGVGLCQWGAFGLASQSVPWREIATRYYPGARLARAW